MYHKKNHTLYEENHMHLPIYRHRATCAWAIVLALVLLVMTGPASAQPVDIPATWGGDFWSRPRLTGSWGGLRDELGKKGVVLDLDLLQIIDQALERTLNASGNGLRDMHTAVVLGLRLYARF